MSVTIEVNLNKHCQECGEPGATQNGLCLGCIANAIGGKRMKSAVGRAVAFRVKKTRSNFTVPEPADA